MTISHRFFDKFIHYHEDPVYAKHAIRSDSSPTTSPRQTSIDAAHEPSTLAHPSSFLGKRWQAIKKVAHEHHESINASYVGYYGSVSEGSQPTSPARRASVEATPRASETHELQETKEHAIQRIGAEERKRHHKEHTLGYGFAAV